MDFENKLIRNSKIFLLGIVNQNYVQHSKEILTTTKRRGNCCLSGDGWCDSPGHNVKYLTYLFMVKETGKIEAMSLIKVSEVNNSNQMEKKGFTKTLQMFKDKNITPMQIRTDHHTQVCTYMRGKETSINHQFDMWHFVKNIKKKLINESQKASCKIPSKWVKSIGNHLWWTYATNEGDVEPLWEK